MKKLSLCISIMLLSMILTLGNVWGKTNIKVELAIGDCKVYNTKTKKTSKLTKTSKLYSYSIVKVGAKGKLVLSINGKKITLNKNTFIKLNQIINKKGAIDKNNLNLIANYSSLNNKHIKRIQHKVSKAVGVRGDRIGMKTDKRAYNNWRSPDKDARSNSKSKNKLKIAWSFYKENKYEEAIEYIKNANSSLTDNEEALLINALSNFKLCNFTKAKKYFRKITDRKSDSETYQIALLYAGINLNYSGEYKESIKLLEKFKKKFPKNEDIALCKYFLVLNYIDLENEKKAVKLLKEIVKKHKDSNVYKTSKELLESIES